MKLRVSVLVEVNLDAAPDAIQHFDTTGEVMDTIKMSIQDAEERVQFILDKYGKKLRAVAGADYSSLYTSIK